MRILVISDDRLQASELQQGFNLSGYSADHAESSNQGSYWARTTDYDLVLIDHTTGTDGVEICKSIRTRGKSMPIMIISDRASASTQIALLNAGADNFVKKSCSFAEILAHVRAIMRRPQSLLGSIYTIDDLSLDTIKYQVSRGKRTIQLTKKEFGVLEYLLRHQEAVITRADLIEHVWDMNADLFSNTLETHMLNLRKKIESPRKRKLIHTISGRGYKIAMNP